MNNEIDNKEIQAIDNASVIYLMDHLNEIQHFTEYYTFTDDLVVAYIYVAFIIIGLPANLIDTGLSVSTKARVS